MQRILFRPFRWANWWRLAILAMAANYASGGVSFSTRGGDFDEQMRQVEEMRRQQGMSGQNPFEAMSEFFHKIAANFDPAVFAGLITFLIVSVIVLALTHLYVGSVLRFVLFQGVCDGNFKLMQGWNRWHEKGVRYFGYQVCLFFVTAFAGFTLVLLPIFAIMRSQGMEPSIHDPGKVLWGVAMNISAVILTALPALIALTIVLTVINSIATSFVVPVMAVEDCGFLDGFARAWSLFRNQLGSLVGFIISTFVLRIGAGIVIGVISVVVVIIAAIPFAILMIAVVGVAHAGGGPSVLMVFLIMFLIFGFITFMLTLLSLCMPPVAVFFQCYFLRYLSGRYPRLEQYMNPQTGQAPPAVPETAPSM